VLTNEVKVANKSILVFMWSELKFIYDFVVFGYHKNGKYFVLFEKKKKKKGKFKYGYLIA